MSGSQYSMLCKGSIRSRKFAARSVFSALFLIAWIPLCFAQEPPLDVPRNKLPARDPDAIAVNGWLLYPTLRIYSLYSDNLFLSPVSRIAVPGFGVTPGLTAEWSNGIHTTTLYGSCRETGLLSENTVSAAMVTMLLRIQCTLPLDSSLRFRYSPRNHGGGMAPPLAGPRTITET